MTQLRELMFQGPKNVTWIPSTIRSSEVSSEKMGIPLRIHVVFLATQGACVISSQGDSVAVEGLVEHSH